MASYVNTFQPLTPEGAAMSNAVDAFFLSGDSPQVRADRQALAALRMEKINTEKAIQAEKQAAVDAMRAQEEGISGFRSGWVGAIPGVDENQANYFFNTGMNPQVEAAGPPQLISAPGYEGGNYEEFPTINAFDDETIRKLRAGRELEAMIRASDRSKLTTATMGDGLKDSSALLAQDSVMRGDIDPTAFLISQGKRPYSQKGARVLNAADGSVTIGEHTPRETAAQELDVARKGAAESQANLYDERATSETNRRALMDKRGEAALISANRKRSGSDKPKAISNSDRTAMRTVLREQLTYASGYDEKDDGEPIMVNVDPQLENEILAEAARLFQDPQSAFYGNVHGAILEAMDVVSPGGYEFTGERPWYDIGEPDYKEGSVEAIKRPGPPSVLRHPHIEYYDSDGESYDWDEIEAEARDQGLTPEQIIEAYNLKPGA